MRRLRQPAVALLALIAVIVIGGLLLPGQLRLPFFARRTPAPSPAPGPADPPVAALSPELQAAIAQYDVPQLLATYRTNMGYRLPGEAENIAVAARLLCGAVLQPGETFSENGRLGPYTKKRGYGMGPMYIGTKVVKAEGGGVCQMSTTLFNAVILADLEIVTRWRHSMTVPYVPAGQDATVASSGKDFRFRNNSPNPILIWAEVTPDYEWLTVWLYSRHTGPEVTWHHQEISRVPYKTRYIDDWALPKGTEKVEIPGADGVTVKSWVTVTYADGSTRTRNFGTASYAPCPGVIRRGMKP